MHDILSHPNPAWESDYRRIVTLGVLGDTAVEQVFADFTQGHLVGMALFRQLPVDKSDDLLLGFDFPDSVAGDDHEFIFAGKFLALNIRLGYHKLLILGQLFLVLERKVAKRPRDVENAVDPAVLDVALGECGEVPPAYRIRWSSFLLVGLCSCERGAARPRWHRMALESPTFTQ
jgi:hypothetical protein